MFVHPEAAVAPDAVLGPGTKVWGQAQVREGAILGRGCVIGKGAYVDAGVRVGDWVKIQNGASVYHGATLEDGVFVGPHVVLTNDRLPRAINPDGSLKVAADWTVTPTLVRRGASLGAASVVVAGVTVGRFAMVGAGSVVTRDVPSHALVVGNPARQVGWVCACGQRLAPEATDWACPACSRRYAEGPSGLEATA